MTSPHLQAEREFLLNRIQAIHNSGDVAPPHIRIEPDFLTPKSWILTHTNLPMKERQLGLHGSSKYKNWEARIHRRDQIQELSQQLALIDELIDRQTKAETLFAETTPTIEIGDVVEFEGNRYRVEDVGFRYLRLINDQEKVTRCLIDQAKLVDQPSAAPAGVG